MGSPIGSLAALWTYPVKGHAARAHASIAVECDGLSGDRIAALVMSDPQHPRHGKTWSGMQHGRLHTMTTGEQGRALARRSRVRVELDTSRRFFDVQPVSLLFDTWLADVERLAGIALDPLRYRPNFFVRAAARWTLGERELVGTRLTVGAVVLDVIAPTYRCVITTFDVQTGDARPALLRELVARRGNILGVYATVVRGGSVRCGDEIHATSAASDGGADRPARTLPT